MKYSTTREAYSEVYEILNFFGDEYKNKIPKELYNFFEKNRDKRYRPKFNLTNIESINEKSISRKAVAILAFLNNEYLSDDEENKIKIKDIYIADQERFKEEVIEDFDDNMVCNSGPDLDTEENTLPAISKEKWYKKILKKIIEFITGNRSDN